MNVRILLLAACMLLPVLVMAGPGETGMASSKIGVGGRIPAMGGAGTAVADAPDAMYWNPAGLLALHNRAELEFMRNQWLLDNNTGNYLGGAVRMGALVLGTGFSLYNSSDIGLYGDKPADDGPLSTFSAHDVSASLAAAYPVTDRLTAGITVNGLYSRIYTESAAGVSVNAGVRYSRFEERLQLGLVIRHAGGTDAMLRERIVLPLTAAAGVSYLFTLGNNAHLLVCGDLVQVRSGAPRLLNGIEFTYRALSARAGYKTSHEYYRDEFTWGGGLSFKKVRVDYAFVPFAGNLGNTHRFAFTLAL